MLFRSAMEVLIATHDMQLDHALIVLNQDLAGTRGCAMSIVRFDKKDQTLECVSVGDVHSHLYNRREAHFFTSTPLILGEGKLTVQKPRIEKVPIEPGSVLVMFSDGLKSRTSLKAQMDVLRQPAITIGQHLLEHDSRPDDDALVLVARL